MTEYRIRAYFKEGPYANRTYGRGHTKQRKTREELEALLPEALRMYTSYPYAKYFSHVQIEGREVSDWEKVD